MRRPRRSIEELRSIHRQIEKNQLLDKRRRRLYNRRYRKSFFFVAVWAGRIIYMFLFITVAATHRIAKESREEIVIHKAIESTIQRSRGSSYRQTELSIETNYAHYTSTFIGHYPPDFSEYDTLLIERNLFHKPIYFTKSAWGYKYYINTHFFTYLIVVFMTFISFFFNDGLDRFTDKVLLMTWALNLISALCYFLY